ncbi:MAG TPA: AbrB/MazE/SpoVT family DNA-binding domain-containing protein [Steroidobacteraceae bacterium]|nr:AbrB/MazE/SpoVT family DNA-binding domain-containing protein [Steroidobacteraceae bacterium]
MQVTVKKWGNSMAVRIPAHVVAAAGLKVDARVVVREENGRIVIEPSPAEYDLDALVAGITRDNVHPGVDFGAPVGREAL